MQPVTHQPPVGFKPAGGLRVDLITHGIGARFRRWSSQENHLKHALRSK